MVNVVRIRSAGLLRSRACRALCFECMQGERVDCLAPSCPLYTWYAYAEYMPDLWWMRPWAEWTGERIPHWNMPKRGPRPKSVTLVSHCGGASRARAVKVFCRHLCETEECRSDCRGVACPFYAWNRYAWGVPNLWWTEPTPHWRAHIGRKLWVDMPVEGDTDASLATVTELWQPSEDLAIVP